MGVNTKIIPVFNQIPHDMEKECLNHSSTKDQCFKITTSFVFFLKLHTRKAYDLE